MRIKNRAIVTGFAGIFFFLSIGSARQVEHWSYERLLKEADLVVIARAVSTVRSEDKWEASLFDGRRFVGMETTFESGAVLKGKWPESLKVLHFQYKPASTRYDDGPGLVTFCKDPLAPSTRRSRVAGEGDLEGLERRVETRAPEYLLFLKKRADGRFEAVAGQVDPDSSVRVLSREGL